jgi:hypothetical protein
MMMKGAAALVAVASAVAPASAGAATGPLAASTGGAMHALASWSIGFPLPDRFQPARSVGGNLPETGVYEHTVSASPTNCVVQFAGRGQLEAARPDVARAAKSAGILGFKVSRSGSYGSLRWFAGKSTSGLAAFAWQAAPSTVRTATRRYVLFQMTVTAVNASPQQSCQSQIATEGATLRTAIRHVHVRKGKP